MIHLVEGPLDGPLPDVSPTYWVYLNEWDFMLYDTDLNRSILMMQKCNASAVLRFLQKQAVEQGFEAWDAAVPPPPQEIQFDPIFGPVETDDEPF